MAFGFPAYHTEDIHLRVTDEEIIEVVKKVLQNLSWSIREETSNYILASTSMNLRSWGEKLHINFFSGGLISVTSKCAFPIQCFDWGKNKTNINRFMTELKKNI